MKHELLVIVLVLTILSLALASSERPADTGKLSGSVICESYFTASLS